MLKNSLSILDIKITFVFRLKSSHKELLKPIIATSYRFSKTQSPARSSDTLMPTRPALQEYVGPIPFLVVPSLKMWNALFNAIVHTYIHLFKMKKKFQK